MYTSSHFENQVENYRRDFVEKMNNDMAQNSKYGEFYEYKANESLWKDVKEFNYTMPKVSNILEIYSVELISLFLWFISILIILFRASSQNKLKYE
jgi:ABC-2 type transport system permease protein